MHELNRAKLIVTFIVQRASMVLGMVNAMKDGRKKHAVALKYPVDLVQPIVKDRIGVFSGLLADKDKLVEDEFLRKLYILMECYKIKDDADHPGWELLFAIVKDWIPGFKILEKSPRARGAPKKNTILGNDELVLAIDQIIEERKKAGASKRNCSVIAACRDYRKSNVRWKTVGADHIKNQYFKAKKSLEIRRKMAYALNGPSIWNTGHTRGRGLLALGALAIKRVEN